MTLLERFLSKVNKASAHWLWTGAMMSSGYGMMRNDEERLEGAHRVSHKLFLGPIPEGLHVLHTRECDVKACVDPEHLYAGTRSQNIQDALALGHMNTPFGGRSGKAVLSDALVQQIKDDPISSRAIAEELGVSTNTVYYARTGRTWKHVRRACAG